jgi:hypothetical protein
MTAPFRESEHVAKIAAHERRLSELEAERARMDAEIERLEKARRRPGVPFLVLCLFLFIPFLGFAFVGSCLWGATAGRFVVTCPTGTPHGTGTGR